jgi:homoserine O-acetyltransferase
LSGPDVHTFSIDAFIPADFRLASGERLAQAAVRGRLVGPRHAPTIAVVGGISSGRAAAVSDDGSPGWWPWAVAQGGPIDLGRVRVLTFDFAPEGIDAPLTITTHDQAQLLCLLLDTLGIARLAAFVGCSYGGMVGLALAEAAPARVERLVIISAAARAHPMAIAQRGIQRRILALAQRAGCEDEGIALARELSMTTYRSAREFAERFDGPAPDAVGGMYPVCEYLGKRGRAYPGVMSAARWASLSDSIDRHRVDAARIAQPTTLIAIEEDRVVPIEDMRALAGRLPRCERLVEASSIFGHDAFLKEPALMGSALADALAPVFAPLAAAA